MVIRVTGTKVEIAIIEELIDKSGLFEENDSSRVWPSKSDADDGGYTKRIRYRHTEKEVFKTQNDTDEELPFS